MRTYHQVKLTHEADDSKGGATDSSEEADTKFNRNYVRTKLENGLLRVWRVRAPLSPKNEFKVVKGGQSAIMSGRG